MSSTVLYKGGRILVVSTIGALALLGGAAQSADKPLADCRSANLGEKVNWEPCALGESGSKMRGAAGPTRSPEGAKMPAKSDASKSDEYQHFLEQRVFRSYAPGG